MRMRWCPDRSIAGSRKESSVRRTGLLARSSCRRESETGQETRPTKCSAGFCSNRYCGCVILAAHRCSRSRRSEEPFYEEVCCSEEGGQDGEEAGPPQVDFGEDKDRQE